MNKHHEGKYVDLEMDGDILIARYKDAPKIDLQAAKEIQQERLTFTNNKRVPVLVIDQGLVSMDRQAREFFSSEAGIEGISASAMIVSSTVNSMLVNFILRISRPNMPVKMFTDKNAAMAWLKTFVHEK